MNDKKVLGWVKRVITGFVLLLSNLFVGMALGLLWVKLFVEVDMGLGGVADFLGGIMVGAFLGLVLSVVMVILLSVRLQWVWIGIAVVVAGLIYTGLRVTAPEREVSPQPTAKKDFEPFFVVNFRINHSREILLAVPPDERPFPFTEAEIFSSKPELIHVDWGPDFERCITAPSDADLQVLLPLVQAVISAAGPRCQTPEDDLKLSVSWNLAGTRDGQGLDAGCLPDKPEVAALADAIGALGDRLCGAEVGGNGTP